MITIMLFFPGDSEYTNVSHLLIDRSVTHFSQKMNIHRKSVIDQLSFRLKHDEVITAKIDTAEGKIYAYAQDEELNYIITGYIAPTHEQTIHEITGDVCLEILDNSYLLDNEISEDIYLPGDMDDPAWPILDTGIPSNSIVGYFLAHAGYNISVLIADDCPDILVNVEQISEKKGDRTYREFLDQLLFEYGFVFDFSGTGHFVVYEWNKDSIVPEAIISDETKVRETSFSISGFSRKKIDADHDGVTLEYTKSAIIENVLLYRENLPVSTTAGSAGFTGRPIGPEDYFPSDGDIEDTFQDYRSDWLDRPYLSRQTRKKNKDISLLATSDHSIDWSADEHIAIHSQSFEQTRAKVLFRNYGVDIENIYYFDIIGKAKYRNEIKKLTTSGDPKKPYEVRAEFIFDDIAAQRLLGGLEANLNYGEWQYSFKLKGKYDSGTILQLIQSNPAINTNVIILTREKTYGLPMYSYTAVGVSEFATPDYKTETTVGPNKVSEGEYIQALTQIETDEELNNRPTYEETFYGFDDTNTGAVSIPERLPSNGKPVSFDIETTGRIAILRWNDFPQLTSIYYWQTQCAYEETPTEWRGFDYVTGGLGSLGSANETEQNSILSSTLVYVNEPKSEPRNYLFRVRLRVLLSDESSVYGDWSDPIMFTLYPIAEGEVGLDAINGPNVNPATFEPAQIVWNPLTERYEYAENSVTGYEIAPESVGDTEIAVPYALSTSKGGNALNTDAVGTAPADVIAGWQDGATAYIRGDVIRGEIEANGIPNNYWDLNNGYFRVGNAAGTKYFFFDGEDVQFSGIDLELTSADLSTFYDGGSKKTVHLADGIFWQDVALGTTYGGWYHDPATGKIALEKDGVDHIRVNYEEIGLPPEVMHNNTPSLMLLSKYGGTTIPAGTSAGWYTIATNGNPQTGADGSIASGTFFIFATQPSRHQTIKFAVSYNCASVPVINLITCSRFGTPPIRHVRIRTGTTYEGAAIDIYIDPNTTYACPVYITLTDSFRWELRNPIIPEISMVGTAVNTWTDIYNWGQGHCRNSIATGVFSSSQFFANNDSLFNDFVTIANLGPTIGGADTGAGTFANAWFKVGVTDGIGFDSNEIYGTLDLALGVALGRYMRHSADYINFYSGTTTRMLRGRVDTDGTFDWHYDMNVDGVLTLDETTILESEATYGGLRITSPSGYIEFGPSSDNICYVNTNRNAFWFNKGAQFNTLSLRGPTFKMSLDNPGSQVIFSNGDFSGHDGLHLLYRDFITEKDIISRSNLRKYLALVPTVDVTDFQTTSGDIYTAYSAIVPNVGDVAWISFFHSKPTIVGFFNRIERLDSTTLQLSGVGCLNTGSLSQGWQLVVINAISGSSTVISMYGYNAGVNDGESVMIG